MESPNARRVSVIIPTYNGAAKIPVLLKALAAQTYLDFEVIVVIDGSTDNTHAVVSAVQFGLPLRIIEQPNQGRSVVKNNGAKNAIGNLFIFYDDDMEPAPDSVQKHVEFHQHHTGIVCGCSLERRSTNKTDIQNYKARLTEKWIEKYSPGLNRLTTKNLFFTAANCSITKENFSQLNGFIATLTDAEDFDLANRALDRGIPAFFDKDNIAVHHDNITCASYVVRCRQYRAAHQEFSVNNKLGESKPGKKFSLFKKTFYWLFSFGGWPLLIDSSRILMVLPENIRYRIYDFVIFSQSVVYSKLKHS
jgi:glycosyltransferase involved in cell wall biosynthesis